MRTRLKVCCMMSEREAREAVRLGADAVGLVAKMPGGPGVIGDDTIAAIARTVPPPIGTFLLTSRIEADDVVRHVVASGCNTVQLVDRVGAGVYAALRARAPGVRIVQVVHVEGPGAIAEAARVWDVVDAVLLDSGRPGAPCRELGGTGRRHDWSISAEVVRACPKPVFLAGGINAGNVAEAIRSVGPHGIDLCSGVRTGGALDAAMLAALVDAMRKADASGDDAGPAGGCGPW